MVKSPMTSSRILLRSPQKSKYMLGVAVSCHMLHTTMKMVPGVSYCRDTQRNKQTTLTVQQREADPPQRLVVHSNFKSHRPPNVNRVRGLGFGVWGLGFGVWEIGRASCRERG